MADTAEMRRLMTHAADLLDECEPTRIAEVAAITTASTVLRMVAACMADEPQPATTGEATR